MTYLTGPGRSLSTKMSQKSGLVSSRELIQAVSKFTNLRKLTCPDVVVVALLGAGGDAFEGESDRMWESDGWDCECGGPS
jgi:hypothetical protein